MRCEYNWKCRLLEFWWNYNLHMYQVSLESSLKTLLILLICNAADFELLDVSELFNNTWPPPAPPPFVINYFTNKVAAVKGFLLKVILWIKLTVLMSWRHHLTEIWDEERCHIQIWGTESRNKKKTYKYCTKQ